MRTLLRGRGLVESPRWHGDRLYFSDWSAGEVVAVDLAGRSEVIARVESLPLCTAWLPDGRLVIVSSPDGLLLRLESDSGYRRIADLVPNHWGVQKSWQSRNLLSVNYLLLDFGRRDAAAPTPGGRPGAPGGVADGDVFEPSFTWNFP